MPIRSEISIWYLLIATVLFGCCFGVWTLVPGASDSPTTVACRVTVLTIGISTLLHGVCTIFGIMQSRVWIVSYVAAFAAPFSFLAIEQQLNPTLFAKIGSYVYGFFAIPFMLPFCVILSMAIHFLLTRTPVTFRNAVQSSDSKIKNLDRRTEQH